MTFPTIPANGSAGYNLTRSLRFRSSASAYLNRTPASAGNRQIFTLSAWVKRGTLSVADSALFAAQTDANNRLYFRFEAGDTLNLYFAVSGSTYDAVTSMVFRDPSAWYHIVIAVDTTQATSTNRVKIYVNGVQQTLGTYSAPPQNTNTQWNNTVAQYISKKDTASNFFDGYMAEVYSIDGQALTPSSFGSTNAATGVWQPAQYVGTYGTNGFYLPFTDNSGATATTIGKDFSGNGNNWTPNNISVTAGVTYDSMTDVPTLTSATAANFAVLNPIYPVALTGTPTINDGNLKFTTGANSFKGVSGTIAIPSSGKYYVEFSTDTTTNNAGPYMGLYVVPSNLNFTQDPTTASGFYGWFIGGTRYLCNGVGGYTQQGSAPVSANGVIQVAIDVDNSKVYFGIANTWYSAVNTTTTAPDAGGTQTFSLNASGYFVGVQGYGSTGTLSINFGQRPFAYTPPTGFVALNTFNLPTSTIVKGNTVMDATLYTGTGASLSVTNTASFKPDLVWVKSRSAATTNKLTDSVRGVTKALSSNSTDAESTDTQGLTAFGSAGFTVGTNTDYNNSGQTYVGWQWQAGQGSSSTNTSGTITSTVSVNASAGFSVVTYTGTGANATVGHGLGVAPSMVIVKQRNDSGTNWLSYHVSLGATQGISLDSISATNTSSTYWNNTAPTSSVFSLGTTTNVNRSTGTYVAYCWTPIAGYSAFGSYTGNSSTDGPFVYTGFRPKYLLIRRTDAAASWLVFDSARDTYNAATKFLRTNLADAETTGADVALDFLSNGFKLRQTSNNINAGTIIYMAFAENPFKNALAR